MKYPAKYRDNNAISGATFKRGTDYGIAHSMRLGEQIKRVFTEYSYLNEYDRPAYVTRKLEKDLLAAALKEWRKKGKWKQLRAKNPIFEMCLNLQAHHTMEDVKLVTAILEKKFGYRITMIAIHRDEGHVDEETGEFVANIHAHIRGLNIAPDGTSLYRKMADKRVMQAFHDEVAKVLGMQRGEKGNGAKHIPSGVYKLRAAAVENLSMEELAKWNKNARKAMQELGATRESYAMIEQFIKSIKEKFKRDESITLEELDKYFSKVINDFKSMKKERDQLKELVKTKEELLNQRDERIAELEAAQTSYQAPKIDTSKLMAYSIQTGDNVSIKNTTIDGQQGFSCGSKVNVDCCSFEAGAMPTLQNVNLKNCLISGFSSNDNLTNLSYVNAEIAKIENQIYINGTALNKKQEMEIKGPNLSLY